MTGGRCPGTVVLFCLAAAGSVTLSAQALQRSLYVSVLDETGAPVPDLGPADFIVREDNVAREVLRVAPADEPMQIAVLVDNSHAARDHIRDIRQGLQELITAMTAEPGAGGRNELAIVGLANRPTILTDYTFDRTQLLKGVGRIFAESDSGAYLLDGLIEVSRGLIKRDARRPVIVTITTEGPEFSSRDFQAVLEPLRAAGAALHVVVLGSPSSDIGDAATNRNIVLDRGPRASGGSRDTLLASTALPNRLRQLAAELSHQYRVTYARPQSLVPPERISVSAARPGRTARGAPVKEARRERP